MMQDLVMKLTFGFCLLAGAASEVSAQAANCAPRDMVVERLADRFGESRQSMGLGARGQVVEIYASHETGTWTITITTPEGLTCMVASGEAYIALHDTLPDNDA